ncbi:MAG: oligosaccharide flippase family protein [Vicingaceae bacterium]
MNKHIKDILSFITDFKNRKGGYIFSAIIISKLLGFLLSFFVIKSISTDEWGLVSYAYIIISFVAPFTGFGIFQSLGRFGPIQDSQNKKSQLFRFIFKRGIIASIVLAAIVVASAKLATQYLPDSYPFLVVISLFIISHFIFETIKIYYRVYGINKLFAYLEISHSIILLILGVSLSFLWGGMGYIIALIVSPLIISLYIIIKNKIFSKIEKVAYSKSYKKSLWAYGMYTSLGGLVSQLIFSIDIITIGFLIKDPTSVALYKTASIIPFSLLFIPVGVMKTDLIKITQNYKNKAFLKNYVKNYFKLFLIIAAVTFTGLYFCASFIMSLFGSEYLIAKDLIPVFGFGLVGAFLFRNPFGNIITCVGWSKTNTIISIAVLLLDIILNVIMVEKYGIIGAAYSTSLLLWIAGIASYIAFKKYLTTLD